MKFYSQYEQDKYLYENFFKDVKNGFFVEIGASDGITFSNSKFFEDLGWEGICIEARTNIIECLRKNRKCIVEHACLSSSNDEKEFISVNGYGSGLSGIKDKCDIKRILEGEGKNSEKEVEIFKCCLINDLLNKYNVKKIDYMSIDVEGSEYDIISTIDFSKFIIDFITVENNDIKDSSVRYFLTDNGYDIIDRLNIDDVFRRIT